jgi:hypothetical protein
MNMAGWWWATDPTPNPARQAASGAAVVAWHLALDHAEHAIAAISTEHRSADYALRLHVTAPPRSQGRLRHWTRPPPL